MKYLRKILLGALSLVQCVYADTADLNHLRIGLGGMYGVYQK